MADLEESLTQFAKTLVDQERARPIVPPQQPKPGFWFGGGNTIQDADGSLLVTGRYRNSGDSRTGIQAGERGCELAIFRSEDKGQSFEKVASFNKADLDVGDKAVLSIEGAALRKLENNAGYELFVSTEKANVGYPAGFEDYLKPGTGVWSIERLTAPTLDGLKDATRETILACDDPRFVHIKDPYFYEAANGDLVLFFCTHPFCWSSSNTGYAIRPAGSETFDAPVFDFFPRGTTWDVAMTRGTCLLDLPAMGPFKDQTVSIMFYDGGECVRNLEEHSQAVSRRRGYSCEELGGAAYALDGDFSQLQRLSVNLPLFVSPNGTGCSRYVDVLSTDDGYYVTWQQSQADGSQPLVMNFVSRTKAEEVLS